MSLTLGAIWAVVMVSAFDAPSHVLNRGDSASPDAPASFISYGPAPEMGVGVDTSVLRVSTPSSEVRLGLSGLAAFANAAKGPFFPGDIARTTFELSAAWARTQWATQQWGPRGVLEFGATLGRRWAFATEGYFDLAPFEPDAVPFGAGGWYLGADLGMRRSRPEADLLARLQLRGYANAWPDLVGAHEASDFVSSATNEGARWQSAFEFGARWHSWPGYQPFVWLYSDLIDPPDDSSKTLWLARVQTGVAAGSGAFEWAPFVGVDVGHGSGLLVNRTELRTSVGLRLYAR